MSNLRKRLDRIRRVVQIEELLADYGYSVRSSGGHREQQFPCDLHGDGRDGKPSARVYPESQSWYCFACDKSRDAVETVRAKEGLSVGQALSFLEKKYGLPFLASDEEDESAPTAFESVASRLDFRRSFGDELKMLVNALETATELRHLPMDTVLAYWEAIDKLVYQVREKIITERVAQAAVVKLYDKLLQTMRDGYGVS